MTTKSAAPRTLAVTATFTAEPLEDSLRFWMREFDLPTEVRFAPYGQVFQQLLDPESLLSRNRNGINIVLVRLEDWRRSASPGSGDAAPDSADREKIERDVEDLLRALKTAAARSAAPGLVCVCPEPARRMADPADAAFLDEMETALGAGVAGIGGVALIKSGELEKLYPVSSYEDPVGEKLGHIPYTPLFYAALGTMIARKVFALSRPPCKVIVLDCDQTLWKGVCGEVGAEGIEIDSPRKALQEFMVARHGAGMLLTLCSKNNEEDVAEVFRRHPEMPLQREHIVSWRINWRPKSENIRSLAEELKLGLESFVLLDDDPVACAEVQANCPQVVTLPLPKEERDLPRFLEHIWALDRGKVTVEDAKRTLLYRQDAERERLGKESLSFEEFLAGLALEVRISGMTAEDVGRVSQLTQRTNQFNMTTVRRSESEIQRLCQSGELECLVANVKDRFGDYGLVGVMMLREEEGCLRVETFLLSCRALGRGVEHRLLARLGEIARKRGLAEVHVPFVPSGKNRPALDFLEEVGGKFRSQSAGGDLLRFPAEHAGSLTFAPGRAKGVTPARLEKEQTILRSSAAPAPSAQATSELLARIASELSAAEAVLQAMESRKRRTRPELSRVFVPPRAREEETLAEIWTRLLRVDRVGIEDDFFELGGHSLLATLLISRVRDAFGVEVSLADFFDAPTVAGLAQQIERSRIEQVGPEEISGLLEELNRLSDEEVRTLLASESLGAREGGA